MYFKTFYWLLEKKIIIIQLLDSQVWCSCAALYIAGANVAK
jgi:hypothetical protein